MKKKFRIVLSAVLLAAVTMLPVTPAEAVPNNGITQGELALMLVEVLGFSRFLPAVPTEYEAMAVLLENGIAPLGGWKPDAPVYAPDLAVILVKALGLQDEVENPDDPQSWMDLLAARGVPINDPDFRVVTGLGELAPMDEAIAPGAAGLAGETDPLLRRTIFAQPDEMDSGVDLAMVMAEDLPSVVFVPLTVPQVVRVITSVPDVPPEPTPVTPD